MPGSVNIRAATAKDVELILQLIRELADYEKLADEVVATPDMLAESLFGPKSCAEALIAEWNGEAAGFALFFQNFSTFLGRPGIYLEDLYVRPQYRGKSIGKRLLQSLAGLALQRDCRRLEWAVLNWNQPAIDFYLSLGATAMDRWTTYRLTGNALQRLGGELTGTP